MSKQLIVICDMEGASGIFEGNGKAFIPGSYEWLEYGRKFITSDVLAVCQAANKMGMDEILIYDGHFAGNKEYNIIIEDMPSNARFFDLPDRKFLWRRMRGQSQLEPYGIITVGQHARYGEDWAYFPHTIQSPPIKEIRFNGIHIAEIGSGVLSFKEAKYVANIGCAASMKEARELSDTVFSIPIKDKKKKWEPTINETFGIIESGVIEALQNWESLKAIGSFDECSFSMELLDGFVFEPPQTIPWKGDFCEKKARWEAPSVDIGLELFNYVRGRIRKI